MPNEGHLIKLSFVGEFGSGKSQLIHRYVDDAFTSANYHYFGQECKVRTINLAGFIVKLELWDVAAHGRYGSRVIKCPEYRGMHGILLVYDCTNVESFAKCTAWFEEIIKYTRELEPKVILIGNKCDMVADRVISQSQGQALAKENGAMFAETSAKDETNLEWVVASLVYEILHELQSIKE